MKGASIHDYPQPAVEETANEQDHQEDKAEETSSSEGASSAEPEASTRG